MIKPDGLNFTTALPTYVNPTKAVGGIIISGTVSDGSTANFSHTLITTIPANLFRADIYGTNNVTNKKVLLNTLLVDTTVTDSYSSVSSELCQMEISYSGQGVTVTYSVFNGTGANITLTAQTITLELVQYQVPF